MNTIKTMMAAVALMLAAVNGQAKPQQKTVVSKTGTLIVYRPGEYVGLARTYAFSIDNGPRYHLKNNSYLRFELPAGDHVVSHPVDISLAFAGRDPQKVRITPGQTVYFQYVIHPFMGMIFEVAEDQVEAKETASGCGPQRLQ
jgi:hypothetical protein